MSKRRTFTLCALVSLLACLIVVTARPKYAAANVAAAQPGQAIFFSAVCKHDGYVVVSSYKCGDSTGTALTVFHGADVASVDLTISLKSGKVLTQRFPGGTDALFLSNVAITKFLSPYYRSVGDKRKTADLEAFTANLAKLDHGSPSSPMRRP